jgi:hypothetical protein
MGPIPTDEARIALFLTLFMLSLLTLTQLGIVSDKEWYQDALRRYSIVSDRYKLSVADKGIITDFLVNARDVNLQEDAPTESH